MILKIPILTTTLPRIQDERGNLSFFESINQIPFKIKRVHWIYDVPGGETRGGLAYKETEEFIIAMSGSFDVVIDNGEGIEKISLNRSYKGIYIPKGSWRAIENFSTNSLALIAASTSYDPKDAIRNYDEFINWAKCNHPVSYGSTQISYETSPVVRTAPIASVYDCSIIELNRHHSQRKGDICVVENGNTVPFDVNRVYYLYDVPGGASRGGHAHKILYQLIVAASGCFTVNLDDGTNKKSVTLNRPYQGLLVKPGIWRTLDNFSSGSVCMVLASEKYDPEDYIRDYNDFIEYRNK